MTLEDMLATAGRWTGKAISATARGTGKTVQAAWNNSDTAWQYTKPLVYGGLVFLGVDQVFKGFDPYIDQNILPYARQYLNSYGSYLTDNASSITATALGGYVGFKTARHFWAEAKENIRARPTFLKKLKATTGLFLIALPTAIALSQVRPDFARDTYNRYVGEPLEQVIAEATHDTLSKSIDEIDAQIIKDKNVSEKTLKSAVALLKSAGYTMSEKDLYLVTRIVAYEAGNYYKHKNTIEKQEKDMAAITHVIANRYFGAHYDDILKNQVNGPGDITFKNIVLKPSQFSIANDASRVKSWEEGYRSKDMLYGISANPKKNKILLAFRTTVKTLLDISRDPHDDLTEGSFSYKNRDVTGNRHRWHNQQFAGPYKTKYGDEIEDHTHYTLYGPKVENVAKEARMNYFPEKFGTIN